MSSPQWNALKNERLKKIRGVSFEEVLQGMVITIKDHPTRKDQHVMLIDYKGYVWVIPFVKTEDGVFLKTLYRNRKLTKLYRKGAL